MTLLADRLGYVQLAEPVRFTAAWERGASLRLRSGDATALDEYDQHGRIRGAPPDMAMDQAARAYVASYLDGRDVLLMAADWARCRELSARIRDDLIRLGLVGNGRTIRIADGVRASVGDLIICRRNDHGIEAGDPAGPWPTGTSCGSRPSPPAASWSAAGWTRTGRPASGVSPRRRSGTTVTDPATWPTRSPGTPRRAPPCIPGSRW